MLSAVERLAGVQLKLIRARQHLDAIVAATTEFAHGECHAVIEEDFANNRGWLTLRLPTAPPELAVVIGDCLYNLRSSLDHMVWQLVLSNPPNRPGRANMFPICSNSTFFSEQMRRLSGVADNARTVIESLQPYGGGNHPLILLDELHNIDKHRSLNLTITIASYADVVWSGREGISIQTARSDTNLRDGAKLLGLRLDSAPMLALRDQMEVRGKAAMFIAFQDVHVDGTPGDSLPVVATLQEIHTFIEATVVPALAPFLK